MTDVAVTILGEQKKICRNRHVKTLAPVNLLQISLWSRSWMTGRGDFVICI